MRGCGCVSWHPVVDVDPPFNSNRDYTVIFRDESGNATDAQPLAFEDTWQS